MHIIISILAASVLGAYLITSNWAATMIVSLLVAALSSIAFVIGKVTNGKSNGLTSVMLVSAMGLAVVLYGVFMGNYALAQHRTLDISAACEAYKVDKKVYPKELSALVPKYLGEIPWAKYTIMYGQFHYDGSKVFFTTEPGMPMPAYDLAKKEWTSTTVYGDVKK